MAHHRRTPKKRGAKCLYISGAPPGAPFQFILCSSLQWRRTAPELPGQASLSDSMTRLSDGMVVQARLHLNQGMGAFFASVGDQFSCLNFFHFRYVLLVFVLVFIEVLTGPHFLQKPGQPVEQIRANPSTCWRTPGAPHCVSPWGLGRPNECRLAKLFS